MTRGEAIEQMRAAARAGAVRFTIHAIERMAERNISRDQVLSAMQRVTFAKQARAGTFAVAQSFTWTCIGEDANGKRVKWAAALAADTVVITVMDPARND